MVKGVMVRESTFVSGRVPIKGCTQSREYSGNSDSGRPGALLILL